VPVEASIDGLLDAPAGGLEQGGRRQGGGGDRPAWRLGAEPTKQLAKDQDHAGVDGAEQRGEHPIDQGPVDQAVDVVQAVPDDGHADRQRDRDDQQRED